MNQLISLLLIRTFGIETIRTIIFDSSLPLTPILRQFITLNQLFL